MSLMPSHGEPSGHMRSQSVRSSATTTTMKAASTIKTIVTTPPWARDEPPSPEENTDPGSSERSLPRPSNVSAASTSHPSTEQSDPSRWWYFTGKGKGRSIQPLTEKPEAPATPSNPQRRGLGVTLASRSRSWMPSSRRFSTAAEKIPESPRDGSMDQDAEGRESVERLASNPWNMHIPMPPKLDVPPITLAHNKTPGWDTPWSPRTAFRLAGRTRTGGVDLAEYYGRDEDADSNVGKWARYKKQLRHFTLTNVYVPLIFRFVNISLTTAALAVAVRIRTLERRYGVEGAVGSSPVLVVIFAPLTLVHVISSIYIEYFGRPLGLYRTSAKLMVTLIETLFICLWSAALSLCFDNFFTSLIPCSRASQVSWYSQLPRPLSPISGMLGKEGDTICDDQLALICLVFLGLLMYCANLVISLFRIFEKVKYAPAASRR